jgi:hypothetical protein
MLFCACVAVALTAGSASASASTLQLSASPTTDSSGYPAVTITASGTADPVEFGDYTVDAYPAPAGATCASEDGVENANLGFPGPLGSAYVAPGSFSRSFVFAPRSSTGGTWALCGYLMDPNDFTTATAETNSTLPGQTPPPPPPSPPASSGKLFLHLSSAKVKGREARVVITMSGALSSNAAPASLLVNLEYGSCNVAGDFVPDSGDDFGITLKSAGQFRRSFAYRPFNSDAGAFSSGGTISVCAYLGRVGYDSFGDQYATLYARAHSRFDYKAPPQAPSRPKPPSQLQKVENAVTNAVAHEPALDVQGPDTYYVVSCRKIGPSTWTCTLETGDTNVYPQLEVTVRKINGRYYVGEFQDAP